jgi:DNA-binding SARP family transcriptional activator
MLGRFEVAWGDRVVLDDTWPRRKARALLKILALAPHCALHRDVVCDILWPKLPPPAASNNLRQTVHQVRIALVRGGFEGDLISTKGDAVSLVDGVSLDVSEFQESAARARASNTGTAAHEAALALYGGTLLPGDAYEPWTEPHRERLRNLRRLLLVEVSDRYLRQGDHAPAEMHLLEVVDADPLDEDAHRRLMRLYAATGRRERAIRQYDSLRSRFRDELGVSPSEETEALLRAIRQV